MSWCQGCQRPGESVWRCEIGSRAVCEVYGYRIFVYNNIYVNLYDNIYVYMYSCMKVEALGVGNNIIGDQERGDEETSLLWMFKVSCNWWYIDIYVNL